MDSLILAQAAGGVFFGLSIVQLICWIMVVAGCIAVLYVVLRVLGIQLPPWFVHILLILAAVVVGVIAVKLIASFI